jgi:hypothetical protein
MRINANLSASRFKKWVEALLLLAVSLILFFSGMPAWVTALALILTLSTFVYKTLFQKASTPLIQLIQFDKQTWRCLVANPNRSRKTITQEGRLLSVHRWFFVLVMRFETLGKNQSIIKSYVIWRDQVDIDDWRRLIVLARFWANDWDETTTSHRFDKDFRP